MSQLNPFIVRFGEHFGLHWYGFAYVLAFLCGFRLYHHLATRGYGEMPPKNVADFITLAAIFGVMLGGRLGWIFFYGFDSIRAHPLNAFKLWEGGMASHGGILGLVIFTYVYARWQHYSWPGVGDNLVVVAPIGLFFGRIANFINGELWGRINPTPHPPGWAAMQFPKEQEAQQPELVARAYAHDPLALNALSHPPSPALSLATLRGGAGGRGALHDPLDHPHPPESPGRDAHGRVHDCLRAPAHPGRTVPRAGCRHRVHLGVDARAVPLAVHDRCRRGICRLRFGHAPLPASGNAAPRGGCPGEVVLR